MTEDCCVFRADVAAGEISCEGIIAAVFECVLCAVMCS